MPLRLSNKDSCTVCACTCSEDAIDATLSHQKTIKALTHACPKMLCILHAALCPIQQHHDIITNDVTFYLGFMCTIMGLGVADPHFEGARLVINQPDMIHMT